MSNLSTLPGSRLLEQLNVAELRDELQKWGTTLKGVEKELFERSEEALKEEDQDGIVFAEHRAALGGAHRSSISGGTEDFEEEGESLYETNDKASKAQDMKNAYPDNAVCENGDAKLLPPSIADMLEPGKEIIGIHEARCDITNSDLKASEKADSALESGFVISDVINASSENCNAYLAMDNTGSVNDAIRSDCALHDAEKTNLLAGAKQAAEQLSKLENLIGASPLDVAIKALMQSTSNLDLPVDKSHLEKDAGDSTTEISSVELQSVCVPLADSTNGELVKPIADERNVIVNEVKPNAKMELMGTYTGLEEKHELVITGEMEKSDVKTGPMEVGAGLENKYMLIGEGIKEVQVDVKMKPMEVDSGIESKHKGNSEGNKEIRICKEDHSQLKSISRESHVKDIKFEFSGSRVETCGVPDNFESIAKHNADLKLMEDDSQAKRKDPDSKQQEPAKRMRRWNSGKESTVDALQPLTTDTVRETILPKDTEGSFVASQKLTPKALATPGESASKVKVEPHSVNTRTVPRSIRAPSNSLKIERFVRPFTLKAVKDLLGEFGQCVDFWMDQIKTHCFVTFSSVSEAVAARNGLYGRQWPPSVGHYLVAEFVDANEVKIRSEGTAEKAQAAQPIAPLRNANSPATPPLVTQSAPYFHTSSTALTPSRFSREKQLPLPPMPKKDPEPAGLTLEDLFFKTKAKPSIYYLPLTDEQVAAAKKINKPPGSK